MATIAIAGIGPGIGKTAVAELLLGSLAGWHVARVRVADEVAADDAGLTADCGYALLGGPEAAARPETRRLAEAGGRGPSVLLANPLGLEQGLRAMLDRLPPDADLLVEGNGFLWARQADVAIMVLGPGRAGRGLAPVRPSVREIVPAIGLWVWNTRSSPSEEGFFEFPQALVRMGFRGAVSNRADFHHVNAAGRSHEGNRAFVEAVGARLAAARHRRRTSDRRAGPPPGARPGGLRGP